MVAELHGIERFRSPRALMAYVGLVPSEHSSSERTRRGGITKAGNSHVRRVIIEATLALSASAARQRGPASSGASGQPAAVIAIADKAQQRLYRRQRHLAARGKTATQAVVAGARELTGFLWAALLHRHQSPARRNAPAVHDREGVERLNRRMPTGTNRKLRALAMRQDSPSSGPALLDCASSRRITVMQLYAERSAQPAYIRVTRRRSALWHPSRSTPPLRLKWPHRKSAAHKYPRIDDLCGRHPNGHTENVPGQTSMTKRRGLTKGRSISVSSREYPVALSY